MRGLGTRPVNLMPLPDAQDEGEEPHGGTGAQGDNQEPSPAHTGEGGCPEPCGECDDAQEERQQEHRHK